METAKKRNRDDVRKAFREFMRQKREENEAAISRLKLYSEKRQAGLI
jgi:hypothetical protein